MIDYLKGKRCMVWSFTGSTRMHEALSNYGDRLDTVGVFTFEVDITGTIAETGTDVSTLATHRAKWPHIKWLLTIMNHGTAAIFTALRNNTGGAKTKFLSEIIRIMQKYPWCAGVDIDLERGGEYENRDAANALFRDIYQTVKSYNPAKLVNICLPGMTSVNGSVGGENWCVYADLNAYCDTAAIMSYGMSWAGSAPGPVSPRSWLEGIYDYAVTAMSPDKIFMGLPAYGWRWQIYDTPENLGQTYRAVSLTYYAALYWMQGVYNFTGDAPPQPFIPFVSFWDDYDKAPWGLLHVYDYLEGADASSFDRPLTKEVYNRRRYLTSYSKEQKAVFDGSVTDRDGVPDSFTGNIIVGQSSATIGDDTGVAVYNFTVTQANEYDIAVRICYPLWDKNAIRISMDGSDTLFTETRLWWPYWRSATWLTLAKGKSLAAGEHTITIGGTGSVPGTQFYGFCICKDFSEQPYAGTAEYALRPQHFKDTTGATAQPNSGFKLTAEVLRRVPDSALIWYEDFRDDNPLNDSYWLKINGEWSVWRGYDPTVTRPYSQLEGKGELALKYSSFSDIHIRARIAFPENGNGRAGVFCGDVFCCINVDTQRVELYQGSSLLGNFQAAFKRTTDADMRYNPTMYLIEMRIRGEQVRVYSGASSSLRFTASIAPTSGYAGLRSDGNILCELLRFGDSWTYEPYEAFDIIMPDGSTQSFGRIDRTGVTWDNEFEVFTLDSDIEEYSTRNEDISMDYDFQHSHLLPITCGGDYTAQYIPHDVNVWISRLYLGDADGFGIMYYSDVDSTVCWSNEAAYHWGLRGVAIWSLGQEDLRLWKAMPKQI